MKRKLALLMAVVMALSLFAGCSSNNGENTANSGKNDSSTAADSVNAGASSDSSGGEVRDSLNIATPMVIETVNPFNSYSLYCNQVRVQLYDALYFYDDITGELVPRLAESYDVTDDGLVYTIKLRQDVTFHNGEQMKATDVVYSINGHMNHPSQVQYTGGIVDVKAVDDFTVEFTMDAPCAPFIANLTELPIVSEKACKDAGEELDSTAVLCGSGPYYVEEYNPDVQIVLKAHEDYYRGAASIKTVTMKPIIDSNTGLIAFENGELDFYSVPASSFNAIESSGKYNTAMMPENHSTYININPKGILADKNLRLAIAHCIDKEAMSIASYAGLSEIADGMWNPTHVFGAPEDPIVYEYDLEKAKEYLAKAGYPDGVDVGSILCIGGGYHEKNMVVFQATLAEIGITCTIEPMEQAAALAQMRTGDFDLLTCGYNGRPDYNFWRGMSHTEAVDTAFIKLGNLGDALPGVAEQVDSLYEQACAELDPEVRKDLYKQLDDVLMETVCWLPIFYRGTTYAWDKDLNAVARSGYYHLYEFGWNS